MAIGNTDILDGVTIDGNSLRLLLTDHLEWQERENTLREYDHLLLLQEKINAYLAYLETKQYKEQYPNNEFESAVIEIHFKYGITENCERFLQVVQNQVGQYGIKIEARIG